MSAAATATGRRRSTPVVIRYVEVDSAIVLPLCRLPPGTAISQNTKHCARNVLAGGGFQTSLIPCHCYLGWRCSPDSRVQNTRQAGSNLKRRYFEAQRRSRAITRSRFIPGDKTSAFWHCLKIYTQVTVKDNRSKLYFTYGVFLTGWLRKRLSKVLRLRSWDFRSDKHLEVRTMENVTCFVKRSPSRIYAVLVLGSNSNFTHGYRGIVVLTWRKHKEICAFKKRDCKMDCDPKLGLTESYSCRIKCTVYRVSSTCILS
jgi:hypothetical protein